MILGFIPRKLKNYKRKTVIGRNFEVVSIVKLELSNMESQAF